MRNGTLGLVMASVAAAALLTGCANEAGGNVAPSIRGAALRPLHLLPAATMEQQVKVTGALRAAEAVAGAPPPAMVMMPAPEPEFRDKYEDVKPNPVKLTREEPVSTFSIDVDTAAYANVRRFLKSGVLPPKDAVRIEELINYFDYTYPQPKAGEAPFATYVTLAPSPFAEGRQLMQIGIQGRDIDHEARPPVNLTLLVDVSGSMHSEDKLPLAKQALKLMLEEMDPADTISIAVYAAQLAKYCRRRRSATSARSSPRSKTCRQAARPLAVRAFALPIPSPNRA